MLETLSDTVRNILGLPLRTRGLMTQFTCAADYDKLPEGLFRLFTSKGAETGFGFRRGNFYAAPIKLPFRYLGELITLDKPVAELPCVQWNVPLPLAAGVIAQSGGMKVIDTDSLNTAASDGGVEYEQADWREGKDFVCGR